MVSPLKVQKTNTQTGGISVLSSLMVGIRKEHGPSEKRMSLTGQFGPRNQQLSPLLAHDFCIT